MRINDHIPSNVTGKELVRIVSQEIGEYLRDPCKLVLLDSEMASYASALIAEGALRPASRALVNASEVAVGTGLLARLPAFPTAPLDELLDLREDLSDPPTRYRRAAADLRAQLLTGLFDSDLDSAVDSVWRTHVAPELTTIREAMAEHGLVREVLRVIGSSPKELAAGTFSSALAIYFGAVGSLDSGWSRSPRGWCGHDGLPLDGSMAQPVLALASVARAFDSGQGRDCRQ